MNFNFLKITLSLFLFIHLTFVAAQVSEGGFPLSLGEKGLSKEFSGIKLSPVNVDAYLQEDETDALNGEKSLRFGIEIPVTFNLNNAGTWSTLISGDRLWRFSIKSTGAFNLNPNFSMFSLPEGAKFFVFAPDGSQVLGAFTNKNHNPDGNFAVMPLAGDEIVFELHEPATVAGKSEIQFESIIHGYRDFYGAMKNFGSSGSCNINVNCPLGEGWENQIRSICMLLTANNSRFCSGAMVNNTNQDGRPFILTARHCQAANNTIFMFNYQSPGCLSINGPTNFTVQGCVTRASRAGTDFALLELNQAPPANYNVFYAGWSNENVIPQTTTGIHHPAGDIKKISRDDDPSVYFTYSNALCWRVQNWEQGTTEGGSSGSPLFDQNKRIVGQLFGGSASCQSITHDNYGRFDVSWATGNQASSRLREWLDSANTGVTTLDGLGDNFVPFAYDLRVVSIDAPVGVYCNVQSITPKIVIRNLGTEVISNFKIKYGVNGPINMTYDWSGTLNPGENTTVELNPLVINIGNNQTLGVEVAEPNGMEDENTSNNFGTSNYSWLEGFPHQLQLTTDNYSDETSWELRDLFTNQILYSVARGDLSDATTYNETFCLPKGCYKFILKDSYGDGICCGFNGNGSYSLTNHENTTLVQGGQFTFQETTEFCVDTILTNIKLLQENLGFTIAPNPTAGQFQLISKSNQKPQGIVEIYNLNGQLLNSFNISESRQMIDISDYNSGIYLLKIIDSNTSQVLRIVKANH